jgi:parallel beta-helix repeat protein
MTVVYVDYDAPGPRDGTSWERAFLTIQEGVDAASPGGEVHVAQSDTPPYAYIENVVMGQGVQLYGGYAGYGAPDPDERIIDVYITTIDGGEPEDPTRGSTVTMAPGARVDGFTITNGRGTQEGESGCGGGFYCVDLGETGAIVNNTISGNTAVGYSAYYGGGIYCSRSSPEIINNTVSNNAASSTEPVGIAYGGGVYLYDSSSTLMDNAISDNTAAGYSAAYGGGICCSHSSPEMADNAISGNTFAITGPWGDGYGGGLYLDESSSTLTRNTISGNGGMSSGYSNCYGGGICCSASALTITDNTISGNGVWAFEGLGCGGGICYSGPSATITDNTISGNRACFTGDSGKASGGGIALSASEATVTSNTIADNTADGSGYFWGDASGGGMSLGISGGTVSHNVIVNNAALAGAYSQYADAWGAGGGVLCSGGSPMLLFNVISSNTASAGADYAYANGGGLSCSGSPVIASNSMSGNKATAGGHSASEGNGGAIYCDGCSGEFTDNTITDNSAQTAGGGLCCAGASSPRMTQNTIAGNSAWQGGGVACQSGSSATMTNNLIRGNAADDLGGGVYCWDGSSPTLTDCTIADNTAGWGGGIYCCDNSNPMVGCCAVTGNAAQGGGGLFCHGSGPAVTDCTIAGNSVGDGGGGGMYCYSYSNPTVTNCTITDNTAGWGGGLFCWGSSATLTNCILWGDSSVEIYVGGGGGPIVTHCDVQRGWAGEGNIDADPVFVDPDAGDYHIMRASPCVDTGDNGAPSLPECDFEGDPRVLDGDSDGEAVADIGVDEVFRAVPGVILVDCNAPGSRHDGISWETAYLKIQQGVEDTDAMNLQVWVADGTYRENVATRQGVAIYGGFLGAEQGGYETELEQRDFENNVTTIDGGGNGPCVVMAVDSRVDGFTVTNGWSRSAGGFFCDGLWQSGTIANNKITGNSGAAGGIWCYDSSPDVINNVISANTADSGGGLSCTGSSPTVVGNLIAGNHAAWHGGGIYCNAQSSPTLIDNKITDNAAGLYGGGIQCYDHSSPIVRGNTISANMAGAGGGISCYRSCSPELIANAILGNSANNGGGIHCQTGSSPTIAANRVAGNAADDDGGGILCVDGCSPIVTENTISGNSAANNAGGIDCRDGSQALLTNNIVCDNTAGADGGGMYCRNGSSLTATNDTLNGNSATNGSGLACDSDMQADPSEVEVTNCILRDGGDEVWNNDGSTITITYSDVEDGWPGEENIDADPMFLDPDQGNYHLSFGSPCIDEGTNGASALPETDWEGEVRVYDGDGDQEEPAQYETADMGADEFVPLLAVAPDPEPGCEGPLFGRPKAGYPGWVWFSIPVDPDGCCGGGNCYNPESLLGFSCSGYLWRWDRYAKTPEVYKRPFAEWDLAVGEGYLLFLWTGVSNPWYWGINPYCPREFEFRLGSQGWTWIGMPGLTPLTGDTFMDSVHVRYPSDETGEHRTARQDYEVAPDNWISWGWPFYDTYLQGPRTFTPYAPFGNRTCYPWIGYRVWVNIGAAIDEDDPDQVTLTWPMAA